MVDNWMPSNKSSSLLESRRSVLGLLCQRQIQAVDNLSSKCWCNGSSCLEQEQRFTADSRGFSIVWGRWSMALKDTLVYRLLDREAVDSKTPGAILKADHVVRRYSFRSSEGVVAIPVPCTSRMTSASCILTFDHGRHLACVWQYAIANIPPVVMFNAKIFKPSRLCAVYRVGGLSEAAQEAMRERIQSVR